MENFGGKVLVENVWWDNYSGKVFGGNAIFGMIQPPAFKKYSIHPEKYSSLKNVNQNIHPQKYSPL